MLVSEEPDSLLATIQSRTQRIHIPRIQDEDIIKALVNNYDLQDTDASSIAHYAEGNMLKALEAIHLNEDKELFFELFVSLMRLAYQRKIRDMKQWSETMASMGRERQKHFLLYCQDMIRENFMYNFHQTSLIHLNHKEEHFSKRFAPFVNEKNIINLMYELNEALRHIEQNVNARMVFFDLSLKTIVSLVQK